MPIVTKVIQLKDIQGNLLLPHAFSASKDNEGNDIINTYATIATVNTKANDNAVVHNTGVETIAGAKTFSTTPIVGTLAQTSSSNAAASTSYVRTAISNEDALVVHLTGDEEISGIKTFTDNGPIILKSNDYVVNTFTDNYNIGQIEWKDKNSTAICYLKTYSDTDGKIWNEFAGTYGTNAWKLGLKVGYDSVADEMFTQAPTPASATDNSSKIATTAWVRNHRCTTNATTTSTASVDAPAYVVQNYKSGTSWYRIWSDGWIEQGGFYYPKTSGTVTVNLPKAYLDTNYNITIAASWSGGHPENVNNSNKKTTSFQLVAGTGSNFGVYWRCAGY